MLRIQDVGELAYGGVVQFAEWQDEKNGRTSIAKKWSTYAYLVPGIAATAVSAFGFMGPKWERWAENLSHGFIYDMPRFVRSVMKTTSNGTGSNAVAQAQAILAAKTGPQISAAYRANSASAPEFNKVGSIF
ncbi:MAG: hypothetical protein PHF31_11890 [Methylobacter sp.]|jgi:hypothetical protein|nr:hypothetical protein [Methylobacter sp.]